MPVIQLDFNTEDANLNLSGSVTFRREMPIERLFIKGLAEWRHVPANILHISKDTIEHLNLKDHGSKLSKIGINYIGLKAQSNILISYNVRASKKLGLQKVQDQLTKFFKAIGATAVKFNVVNVEKAIDDYDGDDY